MVISSTIYIESNTIILVDALGVDDLNTCSRLYDDLRPLSIKHKSPEVEYHKINTRKQFIELLDKVRIRCFQGLKPIIHIEAHGDKHNGIVINKNPLEIASWQESVELFRKINIITKNNLGVVMATCFGITPLLSVDVLKPTPFFFLIGSESKIGAGILSDGMRKFYYSLIEGDSIASAFNQLPNNIVKFIAEKYFVHAISRYFYRQCVGKAAKERAENLLSKHLNSKYIIIKNGLHSTRVSIKEFIKPSKKDFNRFAYIFLHGKCSTSYEQVIALVNKAKIR